MEKYKPEIIENIIIIEKLSELINLIVTIKIIIFLYIPNKL